MVKWPNKAPHKEQRSVIRYPRAKGLGANATQSMHPVYSNKRFRRLSINVWCKTCSWYERHAHGMKHVANK